MNFLGRMVDCDSADVTSTVSSCQIHGLMTRKAQLMTVDSQMGSISWQQVVLAEQRLIASRSTAPIEWTYLVT